MDMQDKNWKNVFRWPHLILLNITVKGQQPKHLKFLNWSISTSVMCIFIVFTNGFIYNHDLLLGPTWHHLEAFGVLVENNCSNANSSCKLYMFTWMCLNNFSSECSFLISLMGLIVNVHICFTFGFISIGEFGTQCEVCKKFAILDYGKNNST
jgi:hypothetical protein